MKDIKVCLVSDTVYDLNGVSRFIQDFAKEAKSYKKEFTVITSTKKNHYESIENIYNLKPIFSIKMPFYKSLDLVMPNFFKIKNNIKKLKPDILHISTPGTVGLCALISAKLLKIPVVGIYHTDFPSYLYENTKSEFVRKITLLYLKVFYKNFIALFSRSNEYVDIIQKQLVFKKRDLYLLKAGINIKNFDKSFKDENIWEEYNIDKNSFKVLYTGRVSIEKNVDKLINIWLEENFLDIKLIVVGDIEIKLDSSKLEEKGVYLLGRKQKEALSKLYASSDCFIFPSTTDTLGQVVLEAMSSALPVIVSDKGGPKTFVSEEFGYIINIEEKNQIIKAIKELKNKDEVYKNKSEKAYNYMRDKSISHSFLDFWEINQKILENLFKK
ncbi:glycosyltransferase [Halarcobacter bivalviorum]|uniref:Glycosyltransferase, family 1 n=1 Tax=Halarcobacter bivalviorum TaxID=663364 RepID=A0AAX2A964_9BACT|nr:glycosyltransferase [Halarcobacter bivalviorum]AXH13521.1 glycosyltransferase, family 1 [Halarcobacter bivalviorum]RXK09883.1 group 1 glycosyl transferase [Halarcobacter bivalviorum]